MFDFAVLLSIWTFGDSNGDLKEMIGGVFG